MFALRDIKNGAPKAIAGAINDTIKKAKTRLLQSKGELRSKVNIKRKDIAPYVDTSKRANVSRLTGRLSVHSSKRLSLAYFGARQTNKGVTYKIERRGARKLIPGAFGYPDGTSGFLWVARRRGRERNPIVFLRGPSAWGVFSKASVVGVTTKIGNDDLRTALDRRVKFMVMVANGTIATKGRIAKVVLG